MIYWFVFLLSLIIVLRYSKVNYQKSSFCIFYVLLIVALGTFRDTTIGTDISTPLGGYYLLWKDPFNVNDIENVEYGFLCFSYFIKNIWDSYYFYYGFIFALSMAMYYYAALRMKINPAVFFAIFFMSSSIITSYNIIRQILALSAAILAYSFTIYKSENYDGEVRLFFKYKNVVIYEVLIMLLSVTIHASVLFLLILPLFHMKEVKNVLSKDIVLWILLLFAIVISLRFGEYVQQLVLLAQASLHIGGRADFWAEFLDMYGDRIASSHGVSSMIISGSIAILASRGRRNALFYIGFIGLLLTNLSSVNLGTLGRLFSNMSLFLVFYYSQIFGELLTSYRMFNVDARWIIIILFVFDWTTGFYFTTILNPTISPYKSHLFL